MSARERQERRHEVQQEFSNRGKWYLLTGLLFGFIVGIIYARAIQPIRWVNTTPVSLATEYKEQYRMLVSEVYASKGDLVRARARLEQLGDEDPIGVLIQQAQRLNAEESTQKIARQMNDLAKALQFGNLPSPTPTSIPGTPTIEALP
jgi:hypothetical protein